MAIDFSNAKILSYTHHNDFAGDIFRYASKKELTIEGSIYALTNQVGVHPIWSGITGFVKSANDYDNVILNGTSFGSGRINSINFKEGNDVRQKDYTVNLTIFETGNLFNLTGEYYSGLNFNSINAPVRLVENFSENFDFQIKDDGTYQYKQAVNVKFVSGKLAPNTKSAIQMAQTFASGLLFSSPAFGFIDDTHAGWYTQSGRRTYTENYNLITNECSFSENFAFDTPGAYANYYSIKYDHQIQTDENGVTNVTENGRIRGLRPDYFLSAESGYDLESSHFYTRSSGVMDYYVPSGYPPAQAHVTLHKKINQFLGEIEYGITYTNDPRFNINYIWEYTENIQRQPNSCFYRITEDGQIKGRDNNCTYTQKNQNALNAYNVIKTGILQRVSGYYTSGTALHNPLKLVASNKRHNPFLGQIDYSASYVDNLYYGVHPNIKKVDYEIEDNQPVIKANRFGIINAKELLQRTSIYTEGNFTCHIQIQGERGASLNTCLSAATGILTGNNLPTGLNYLDRCNYNFSPNRSALDFNATWIYFQRN